MGRALFRIALAAVFLLLGACSVDGDGGPDQSSTTTPPATTQPSPSTTTVPPQSSTTLAIEASLPDGAAVLITYDDALSVRLPDGTNLSLPGDFEVPLAIAFDDLNGGIVFQYATSSTSLDESILHLRGGAGLPVSLVTAQEGHQLRLLDVDLYNERLHALYIDRSADGSQELKVVGLDGGAPTSLLAGRGLLSGSLTSNAFSYTQQLPACRAGVVADPAGSELASFDCPEGGAGLVVGGTRAAWRSSDGVKVAELGGEVIDSGWTADDRVTSQLFDFDGTTAVVRASSTAFRFLAGDGSATRFETGQRIRFVSLLRAPITLAANASLGGLAAPSEQCSASGFPSEPTPVDGLTLAATDTRNSIVSAAHDCDYAALDALAGQDLTVPATRDVGRYWLEREQNRFDDLAVLIRILEMSYSQSVGDDGEPIFVWPAAAAVESPTESQWAELGAVYNEEDVEEMRQDGRYGGVVVAIDLDGRWLSAGIQDS